MEFHGYYSSLLYRTNKLKPLLAKKEVKSWLKPEQYVKLDARSQCMQRTEDKEQVCIANSKMQLKKEYGYCPQGAFSLQQ